MWFQTKVVYLTQGVAVGGTPLNAFDNAMRMAGIADFNIIRVTSIVPPRVPTKIWTADGRVIKGQGHMLPAVYESLHSSVPGETISAGVAVGVPVENELNSGVIFTYSAKESEAHVENVLRSMIDEGMKEMRLVQKYDFKCAIASATVQNEHTCAFAAAPFCNEPLDLLFTS